MLLPSPIVSTQGVVGQHIAAMPSKLGRLELGPVAVHLLTRGPDNADAAGVQVVTYV